MAEEHAKAIAAARRTGRRVLPREGAEVRPQIGGWKQDHFRVRLGGAKASRDKQIAPV